jgi:hypothetical protein
MKSSNHCTNVVAAVSLHSASPVYPGLLHTAEQIFFWKKILMNPENKRTLL